ncbi:TetR/AcrR family transcriptional regulator [Nocardia mexicana]|uniref:TetR family transcriptional regulator n=1 Tax=Nocardia mexicana TaxID=279262 RepID=A0A370GK83_9NOCA|nr:TetR/AcrR family transcriptional regulator [Nocardia mexicana]RDI43626.1 TetR family transcriptional regulator [Nocardia mexicana]
MARRVRPSARQRRDEILDTALDLVIAQGYPGCTMQSIARTLGVTRPALYEYYRDHEQLLADLVAREHQKAVELVVRCTSAAAEVEDPRQLSEALLREYFDAVTQAPRTWRLILISPVGAPQQVRDDIDAVRRMVLEQLRFAIRSLPAPFGGPGADSELLALSFIAGAEAAARLVLDDPGRFPPERLTAVLSALAGRVTRTWPH